MKKVLLPILALVISLGLMVTMITPAMAADVYQYHYQVSGADAYWSIYDQETGADTSVTIHTDEGLFHNPPQSGRPEYARSVNIDIFKYIPEPFSEPLVQHIVYSGSVPEECLIIDNKLAYASLSANGLEAWDYISETPVTVDVDVSWTAIGPLVRSNYTMHINKPDGPVNFHRNSTERDATAQGGCHFR